MTRRTKGHGSIVKQKNGTYRIRVSKGKKITENRTLKLELQRIAKKQKKN